MSLFGKTIVVRGGMTQRDADDLLKGLTEVFDSIAERLRGHDAEIAELKAEIERLKREPRKTVAQRARERGLA
jgi:cell division protein FtsB